MSNLEGALIDSTKTKQFSFLANALQKQNLMTDIKILDTDISSERYKLRNFNELELSEIQSINFPNHQPRTSPYKQLDGILNSTPKLSSPSRPLLRKVLSNSLKRLSHDFSRTHVLNVYEMSPSQYKSLEQTPKLLSIKKSPHLLHRKSFPKVFEFTSLKDRLSSLSTEKSREHSIDSRQSHNDLLFHAPQTSYDHKILAKRSTLSLDCSPIKYSNTKSILSSLFENSESTALSSLSTSHFLKRMTEPIIEPISPADKVLMKKPSHNRNIQLRRKHLNKLASPILQSIDASQTSMYNSLERSKEEETPKMKNWYFHNPKPNRAKRNVRILNKSENIKNFSEQLSELETPELKGRTFLVFNSNISKKLESFKLNLPSMFSNSGISSGGKEDYIQLQNLISEKFSLGSQGKFGIYLINGEPIYNLESIPLQNKILIADQSSVFCSFKRYFLIYHNRTSIKEDKWNLILHLVNSNYLNEKLVKYYLFDKDFINTLLEDPKFQFNSLLKQKNLLSMKPVRIGPQKSTSFLNNVTQTLNFLADAVAENQSSPEHRINEDIIKGLDKKYTEYFNQKMEKEEPQRFQLNKKFQEFFTDLNLFVLDKEANPTYIKTLDQMLPKLDSYEQLYDTNIARDEATGLLPNRFRQTKAMVEKAFEQVSRQCPPLSSMNIPRMNIDSKFTRAELYKLYSKYKALCMEHAILNKHELEDPIGLDVKTFKGGFPQFILTPNSTVEHILTNNGPNIKFGIPWPRFLKMMSLIKGRSLKDKIMLFCAVMDSNLDGKISRSDMASICQGILACYKSGNNDHLIEGLSDYITKSTFKAMNCESDEEIPIDIFIHNLNNHIEELDLLLKLSGAEKHLHDDEKHDHHYKASIRPAKVHRQAETNFEFGKSCFLQNSDSLPLAMFEQNQDEDDS